MGELEATRTKRKAARQKLIEAARQKCRENNEYTGMMRRLMSTPFETLSCKFDFEPQSRRLVQTETVQTTETDMIDEIEYYFGFSCVMQLVWIGLGCYLYKRCTQK